ncbi:MAG: acyl-CoA/acyl-ACP dehydrogenase [Candidatus Rokubacteria bacterium]|nr:acyl-CoA/acyl-ACP dehydrogenase [Candidatus Rokubacteria bacterium]
MDITLTKEADSLRSTALAFAQHALTHDRIRALEGSDGGFEPDVWRDMATMGWSGCVFPLEMGGAGLGLFELALIVEACGQAALPSPMFASVVEAGMLLLESGVERHRAAWVPRIAAGDAILTTAVFEPGNAELETVATTATPLPGGYRIDGTKTFVRDAATARAIVTLARCPDSPDGLALLLVPSGLRGVRRQRLSSSGGEALWEVAFDGVSVPATALVTEPGQALAALDRLLARGACLKAAELVGIGQAALDLTVAYAKTRVQFERPLGSFQAVQHHCATMYRDLRVCRLLMWEAAARLAAGQPAQREVAMAKAKTSDAIPALTRTAHQIHGAIAYYRDYPLELYYTRAVAAAAAYGNATYHRRALAHLLAHDLDTFRGDIHHGLPVRPR